MSYLEHEEVVGFPDDDCWYPENFFESVSAFFKGKAEIDGICCRVIDPGTGRALGGRPTGVATVSSLNIFRLPISVGIFLKRAVLMGEHVIFDEGLGAGTKLGSGEETELLSRLLSRGASIQYRGDLEVYHEVISTSQVSGSKVESYGYGFGVVATKILNRGQLGVVLEILIFLSRSAAGWLVFLPRGGFNNIYWRRLASSIKGLGGENRGGISK